PSERMYRSRRHENKGGRVHRKTGEIDAKRAFPARDPENLIEIMSMGAMAIAAELVSFFERRDVQAFPGVDRIV
ncbi:MAG TPA: hypothetical protein VF207_01835, partial [Chthoniobacterales bacterium]